MNGNISLTSKRRKNREKSTVKQSTVDFNTSNYSNFHSAMNSFSNSNIPEHPSYYFPINYHQQQVSTEPMSLPVYPYVYNFPFHSTNGSNGNSTSKLNSFPNHPTINNETNEYMSLPVEPLDPNVDTSDKRRFSDPGVPYDSDSSSNSIDERLVHKLTQQVNALKDSNRKLNREVVQMRIELNLLKQQQNARHSERDYEPGMLAEVIREIRDAARVREDALLAKVKYMIEEKQFSMSQLNLATDKARNNDRLAKLEEQLKSISLNIPYNRPENNAALSSSSAIEDNSSSARQLIELEREALFLRRELQEVRAKKEESDQKLIQLDKKLLTTLRSKEVLRSDASEDGKPSSGSEILNTSTSLISSAPVVSQRVVTLTGPVTDL